MEEKKKQIVDQACHLWQQKYQDTPVQVSAVLSLTGDGSQRHFLRISFDDGRSIVAVMPSLLHSQERDEARSAWLIGRHLYRAGLPVPEPLAYDPENGLILFEDLGDLRLHDHVSGAAKIGEGELLSLYREVVRELVRLQVIGGRGFDGGWCWQTPVYDRKLMLERESGYFADALCHSFLDIDAGSPALRQEFAHIAEQASAAPARFFLHRDFQSRNLMLKDGRIRIIDFQGGRYGPLGYDLASLLLDPYMSLPAKMQEALLGTYIEELQHYTPYDPGRFRQEYFYLALQRNLQILGAFAFLGGQQGKKFFLPFIRPALFSLQALLAKAEKQQYPVLVQLVQNCVEKTEHHEL